MTERTGHHSFLIESDKSDPNAVKVIYKGDSLSMILHK